jgi:hypothetical protein
MSGKVADGPNAGIRCHGSIVALLAARTAEAALMEPIAGRFGSEAG